MTPRDHRFHAVALEESLGLKQFAQHFSEAKVTVCYLPSAVPVPVPPPRWCAMSKRYARTRRSLASTWTGMKRSWSTRWQRSAWPRCSSVCPAVASRQLLLCGPAAV